MPIQEDLATVAFCDAQFTQEIQKGLNKAGGALMHHGITLTREDLEKFKARREIVRIGSGHGHGHVKAAGGLRIAASCMHSGRDGGRNRLPHPHVSRRSAWLYQALQEGVRAQSAEQIRRLPRAWGQGAHVRGRHWASLASVTVGQAVAVRAKAFGFSVLFYNPYLQDGVERPLGV